MPSTSLELCAGTSDSDVVQQGVQTISECKLQCVTTSACKGIEFAAVGGTCKLLTGPDSWKPGRGRERSLVFSASERLQIDVVLVVLFHPNHRSSPSNFCMGKVIEVIQMLA